MEAAFFDLDKTVIAKASLAAFGRPLYEAGLISRRLVLRVMWGQFLFRLFGAGEERMRKVRESALRITRGWDQAKVNAIVRETLTDVIEPIVFDEALDLIRAHREAGRRVFIVSASPEEIVAPLARYLGVDEAIATRARLDDGGRYTGEVELYVYGPEKAEAIRRIARLEGVDLTASYAYSDSVTDLPMLEAVGIPVAVNPDRDLLREAREREWEILSFEEPVPLRERAPLPPAGRTIALGATLVAAAVAAVVWWLVWREPEPPPSLAQQAAQRWKSVSASGKSVSGRGRRVAERWVSASGRKMLRRRPAASSRRWLPGRPGR